MLDFSHLHDSNADVQIYVGSGTTTQTYTHTWNKPRGKTMANIFLVGHGGNGGNGAIGANSAAAGGGGGGSGGQVSITVPLWAIPDILFLTIPAAGSVSLNSYVSITQNITPNNTLTAALPGGVGGNASLGTVGSGGGGAGSLSASGIPLGWQWLESNISGHAGGAGGAGVVLPTNGLIVTCGTGGGALPASGQNGNRGSNITGSGVTTGNTYGVVAVGPTTATERPQDGPDGRKQADMLFFYGGLGGCSTHGDATGTGLVQSNGGNGAPGCGGGGSGGALTGSTPGFPGKGGPSFCIITCW